MTFASASAQLFRENIFGLDVPIRRWTRDTDMSYFNGPARHIMGLPSDIPVTSGRSPESVFGA